MKRLFGWGVVVVALVGVGVMIHLGTPPSPRWTVPMGSDAALSWALHDDRLVAMTWAPEGQGGSPVVLDAATGATLLKESRDGIAEKWFVVSPDRRWIITAASSKGPMRLIWYDLKTLARQEITRPDVKGIRVMFMPREQRVILEESFQAKTSMHRLMLFNPATGEVSEVPGAVGNKPMLLQVAGSRLFFQREAEGAKFITDWDARTGRGTTTLECSESFVVSPDGQRVITGGKNASLWTWEGTPRALAKIAQQYGSAQFTPDGRRVVVQTMRAAGVTYHCLDSATGREAGIHRIPPQSMAWVVGDALVGNSLGSIEVRSLDDLSVLWTRSGIARIAASPDAQTLLLVSGTAEVEVADAATGETRAKLPWPFGGFDDPVFAASGRQVWLSGSGTFPEPETWFTKALAWIRPPAKERSTLQGYEWPSMRPLFRLTDRGVWTYKVAADGTFVITVHKEGDGNVLRRWDLPQPRPWLWSVGVPLALGLLLVAIVRLWPRRGNFSPLPRENPCNPPAVAP